MLKSKYDSKYMIEAIKQAKIAYSLNEVPVGAVVVKDNEIIGLGFNQVIRNNSVIAHAEIIAIQMASANIKNYRLNNCSIYSTLEPCHMCAKAIVDARIQDLYIGALEPKTGAVHSIDRLLDNPNLNHKVNYSAGHKKEMCGSLLTNFFQSKRC